MHPARAGCVRVALPIVAWLPGRPLSSVDPSHHLAIVNAAFAARGPALSPKEGRPRNVRPWLLRNVTATARRNSIDATVVDLHGCVEAMVLAMTNNTES